MTQPILLIISGAPGTGKSFLARKILARYPVFSILSYDDVKEKHFDLYGFSNIHEKSALNQRALQVFYCQLNEQMRTRNNLLIEYPFYQLHKPILSQLVKYHSYSPITIFLYAEHTVLAQRCYIRDQSPTRHPGHLYNSYHKGTRPSCPIPPMTPALFIKMTQNRDYNISLGETIMLDVSDYNRLKLDSVWNILDSCLHHS